MKQLTLYGYWRSSSSWRVRIGLAIKGLEYAVKPVHLLNEGGEQNSDEFIDRNPLQQVPVLEWEEAGTMQRMTQSVAILRMLDLIQPDPSLEPRLPMRAARMWEMTEIINSGIQPVQNLSMIQRVNKLGGDAREMSRKAIHKGFVAIERILETTAERFSMGSELSIADCCLVPQVYNARRFELDLEPFPNIVRVDRECAQLEPFVLSHPSNQPDAVE